MRKELSHDEQMYVAGGELPAQGLLPYRDYPYLQMPNLAFTYAGTDPLAGPLSLGGFSAVSASGAPTDGQLTSRTHRARATSFVS